MSRSNKQALIIGGVVLLFVVLMGVVMISVIKVDIKDDEQEKKQTIKKEDKKVEVEKLAIKAGGYIPENKIDEVKSALTETRKHEEAKEDNDEKEKEKEEDKKNIIISINSIINKPLLEVESVLKKADKTEEVSASYCVKMPCKKAYFQSGKYEIIFIDEKASLITIAPEKQYELNDNSVILIGVNEKKPTFKNDSIVIRWENLENIKEVSFFDNGLGYIDYIYVKSD